jgi:hypothetical protein
MNMPNLRELRLETLQHDPVPAPKIMFVFIRSRLGSRLAIANTRLNPTTPRRNVLQIWLFLADLMTSLSTVL